MPKPDPFRDFVLDQLSEWPDVTTRAMFGGVCFYRSGKVFGLIADGDFYLKETDANAEKLAEMDTPLFTYPKKDGTTATMRYRRVSADVLEDRERLMGYAQTAIGL
jgi:DNA transformation protein and related proteins